MNIPFFDYLRQYKSIEQEILSETGKVLSSGQLFFGAETRKLERGFSDFTGAKHCVAVSSGTDALYIALKTLGIGHGDEVITVSNTAVPTISAIRMTGANPVFADVNHASGLIDINAIPSLINTKTKVILPVHLYGAFCEMDKIREIADKHHLFIVEDCAQACGTSYNGRHAGRYSDIGCFSFYPTKNLGAYGDGGCVITDNDEYFERAAKIRFYGFDEDRRSVTEGINGRMDEIQAAVLNLKLKYLSKWIATRKSIAQYYIEKIKNSLISLPEKDEFCSYHLFIISTTHRDRLVQYLKKNGIATAVHYPVPIHQMKAYDFPNLHLYATEKRAGEILSLPLFPELQQDELDYICDTLNKFE
ncbi:MAG: hypothetical protein UT30_C0017G0028 [Candidatus Uhrbacteria bacterium GW2011_GWF2_39_13]|uniref:Glutamine-scyllo-inositol transaminase n=1 Tax=Candidatus Uhrbacteria bacterium GW2011_GWF2_39_13 TaxID=1618995 RepID=A0A0G0MIL1_9BACT|nr:MAG: hypothetical protein UT30_C0017G0028 [Candidatus Uhrbacteria bacterium GW2011_GWF2_39_13]